MDKKRANAKQTRLLWVDLEMTGLDPVEDRILEVAAIVTDWNFTELASYECSNTVCLSPSAGVPVNPPGKGSIN